MGTIPRHQFIPPHLAAEAYADGPLPIGFGQTISQPFMVALMTSLLSLKGRERVLEIGTGSGYQTAVLSRLAGHVYSIERLPELLEAAGRRLSAPDFANVSLQLGDGSRGWPEHAPYHAIIVSAATPEVPAPLMAQLHEGGRLVLPLGPPDSQVVTVVERSQGRVVCREIAGCVFVPLIAGPAPTQECP
jgi:protein-L-isoaspartate(D-aspartate) O-methyltransferase